MPFRIVIVDDEPLAREYLKSLLSEDEEIEIVAICKGGKEAVQSIKKLAPEIVFLDVQMPGLDGFGVIHSIGASAMPAIIFVTAFDKYAIQAFETHAADYLLKPFDRERLIKALDHVKKEIRTRKTGGDLAKRLREILVQYADLEVSAGFGRGVSGGQYLERIPIKTVDKSYIVKTLDIDWIETADTYLVLHARGKQHVLRETMKWAETHLDPNRFFRIHRQAIVNIDKIKELQAGWHGSFRVLLENGTQLQLSRRRRRDLEKLLGRSI